MLAVSTLRDERGEVPAESFPIKDDEISDGNFLQDFDFDDFFISIDDGDILPDLEMDTEMLADFSVSSNEFEANVVVENAEKEKREEEEKVKGSPVSEETAKREESTVGALDSGKANRQKNNKGKRKVKVDWTPELHRRFVQAVEQLGLDKAVPSRILELMGIDCLTRHNIASHLQKYRSHRKHLLAREAEAASWSQRRQIYGGGKRDGNPWIAAVPSMGFPPPSPIQPFRPLHVWGHPTVDQSLIHVWPKHLLPLPPPPPWAPPPPSDPSFWHHHHLHRASKDAWVQNTPTPGTPCFPQPLTTTRLSAPPVPGILPPILYKPDNSMAFPQSGSQRQFDFHPSKETIDAAIGDVLAKPWLPLPLGLKPPSPESVLVELQRQGISKLPPSCS